mmetsp:Transcript_61194/g.175561  ORF Transcript_61194/g.175561 Transcript_61194/m.175561 type:complete len:401 (+) Transcript_61194:771-1973(+)
MLPPQDPLHAEHRLAQQLLPLLSLPEAYQQLPQVDARLQRVHMLCPKNAPSDAQRGFVASSRLRLLTCICEYHGLVVRSLKCQGMFGTEGLTECRVGGPGMNQGTFVLTLSMEHQRQVVACRQLEVSAAAHVRQLGDAFFEEQRSLGVAALLPQLRCDGYLLLAPVKLLLGRRLRFRSLLFLHICAQLLRQKLLRPAHEWLVTDPARKVSFIVLTTRFPSFQEARGAEEAQRAPASANIGQEVKPWPVVLHANPAGPALDFGFPPHHRSLPEARGPAAPRDRQPHAAQQFARAPARRRQRRRRHCVGVDGLQCSGALDLLHIHGLSSEWSPPSLQRVEPVQQLRRLPLQQRLDGASAPSALDLDLGLCLPIRSRLRLQIYFTHSESQLSQRTDVQQITCL